MFESVIHEELARWLEGTVARGRFATHWRGPATDLALEVKGVGPLRFPVSAATVRAMRAAAEPARFGKGEETILDRRVRDAWVVAKSRVKIDGTAWRKTLGPALARIHSELALPPGTKLEARLHDLLFYEKGQFFLAHRDAQKRPDMIGTLVVILPSSFSGCASVVSHEKESVVVEGSSRSALTFLAFFSDCEHEVRSVERGHRLALTYELSLKGTPAIPLPGTKKIERVAALVEEHFETAVPAHYRGPALRPDRLVYLLDPRRRSAHGLAAGAAPSRGAAHEAAGDACVAPRAARGG